MTTDITGFLIDTLIIVIAYFCGVYTGAAKSGYLLIIKANDVTFRRGNNDND